MLRDEPQKNWGRQPALPLESAALCQKWCIIEKELSSATHVAEAADGGWKPPRLVANPAAAAEPFR